MEHFSVAIEIAAPPATVLEACWRLEDWPAVAPHVCGIDMHFADEDAQVLTMRVVTRGRSDSFKSVRVRQLESIFYIQPAPPPLLDHHHGWWRVAGRAGNTVLTSTHVVAINTARAAPLLRELGSAAAGEDGIRAEVRKILTGNSMQTMQALKRRLETQEEDDHVAKPGEWTS